MTRRVFVEKKQGFDIEGRRLKTELADFLGPQFPEFKNLNSLRILRRYDAEGVDENQFEKITDAVFSEPQCDNVYYTAAVPAQKNERYFGIEYVPGQYDQRADSAEQCAELACGARPKIKTAGIYIFETDGGPISDKALEAAKKYLLNPVDSREADMGPPGSGETSRNDSNAAAQDGELKVKSIAVFEGFINADKSCLEELIKKHGLAMSIDDLVFCRDYFKKENRDPTITEISIIDTYWSDHCRHTTFNTVLEEIKIVPAGNGALGKSGLEKALLLYEEAREEAYGEKQTEKKKSLMDIALVGAKVLKKRGLARNVDESAEINACTLKIDAEFPGGKEPWLLLFKNETHNHPTEIEPFGGAATCLGGAIRDPLSGRAFVHQAMRITGGGDPRAAASGTLPGKLPQQKIARGAAAGYSSYGNQIGLPAGQVSEFYHEGFIAKRMELGAVIGAVPADWVRREEPEPGDLVILAGGRTGRDGIGGATGSSKTHTGQSVETAGAEVQKGNAVEERKLQRLFRKKEVCRLIKRCNDFGAGGVSVAVGELAAGLDINLDHVPKKYAGLDGTELAISESQERMAVVVSKEDSGEFICLAAEENLEAVVIANVTAGSENEDGARLRMFWQGKTIVNISRAFLNTNGASRTANVLLRAESPSFIQPEKPEAKSPVPAGVLLDNLERELVSLRSGSRRGLQERFDGSNGACAVLFPWGGSEQGTPECGMASLLPSLGERSSTASLMTFGYNPALAEADPYEGAKGAVREALAKFCCLGGDFRNARLSLQEYFERPENPESWGKPAATLLGALEAQLRLGVPAIGGKDSMSGTYRDPDRGINLKVPPTLVCFAAGTTNAAGVTSGALSGKEGSYIILIGGKTAGENSNSADAKDEWESFAAGMDSLKSLMKKGAVRAAYPVPAGGVAAGLALMSFGNAVGVEAYAASFGAVNEKNYQGSVLAEVDEDAARSGDNWLIAARVLNEPVFRIVGELSDLPEDGMSDNLAAEIPLEVLRRAYEFPLSQIYAQTSTGATAAEPPDEEEPLVIPEIKVKTLKAGKSGRTQGALSGAPLAVLPVFPGTNCEWDMERAFREAGARTKLLVFKNRNREDIKASIEEMRGAFNEAQIIAFSGGFSAGDEPDGSGKFIANVIRSPAITEALTDFLEKKDGLIIGICNGFQALIKTGLLPYGRVLTAKGGMPTLSFNAIGRHVSRMVRTRVMPCNSPWTSLETPGAIHIIPVSHGEGRVVISRKEATSLFEAGQVPFCYAGAGGFPTMAEPANPNGSAFAIEGLTSPDGRILGKMGHSERCGDFVHVNIPGEKKQRIFESGVKYFT